MILFGLTNFAILIVITVVWQVLGLDQIMYANGVNADIVRILPIALAFGMGGSIISLLLSKKMALMSTRAKVIENPSNATEQWLLQTVKMQAEDAGIGMPDVAIYNGPEMNAFATGARRNNALVAVSTGLLRNMNQDEVEAVLAHEVSHVANGDMITLSLIQGVLNTFVIIFSRVIGRMLDQMLFRRDGQSGGHGIGYFAMTILAEVLLGFLAHMIVMAFSRYREFRADAGGAQLAGRQKMANALRRLQTQQAANNPVQLPEELHAFGIFGGGGVGRLFMSHPPLEERIAALENVDSVRR
jgi:heat shock protein HtpX